MQKITWFNEVIFLVNITSARGENVLGRVCFFVCPSDVPKKIDDILVMIQITMQTRIQFFLPISLWPENNLLNCGFDQYRKPNQTQNLIDPINTQLGWRRFEK